ncbi:squalene epoxidase-domain-containing protein [Hygrophoropsis aurantiaca]|uniref:Squalene epoxidase-domain-containing protein n=1 Tax=Hygrophoropsis aurantiaca TaxID=72124 RepID=A0ACB8AE85_9AGAM|nr:squalene epoxidase-domain-containing protein [Hygrophoropsis aurantiaca]
MNTYDVIIVGAGIAGSALAHALSSQTKTRPLRIALLERSLSEPDRIVGELLQPAGVAALNTLGLSSCLEDIDAIPVHGYAVVRGHDLVHIPYPDGRQGRSFHHGRFIMKLRDAAKKAVGVDVIEATVSGLVECPQTERVLGVRASRSSSVSDTVQEEKEEFYAHLTIIADGCFSNFRSAVLGSSLRPTATRSYFAGLILKDAKLPIPQHGTVALVKGQGPVLIYQISEGDTRMLVDVKQPVPSDLKGHILTNVVPSLPPSLHAPIRTALDANRLRRMPNSFLPPTPQGRRKTKDGVILLGDAWNMRHPLTGGGMTVALNDVVWLSRSLCELETLENWEEIRPILGKWWWERKGLAGTINILSVALYDLFGADDDALEVLQTGCFKYFERGGECVRGPVSLLSGIAPSTSLLAYHFFSVAFFAIWVLFTHPRVCSSSSYDTNGHANGTNNGPAHVTTNGNAHDKKKIMLAPRIHEYPGLCVKSIQVFWTACVVFGPLLWTEMKWW